MTKTFRNKVSFVRRKIYHAYFLAWMFVLLLFNITFPIYGVMALAKDSLVCIIIMMLLQVVSIFANSLTLSHDIHLPLLMTLWLSSNYVAMLYNQTNQLGQLVYKEALVLFLKVVTTLVYLFSLMASIIELMENSNNRIDPKDLGILLVYHTLVSCFGMIFVIKENLSLVYTLVVLDFIMLVFLETAEFLVSIIFCTMEILLTVLYGFVLWKRNKQQSQNTRNELINVKDGCFSSDESFELKF